MASWGSLCAKAAADVAVVVDPFCPSLLNTLGDTGATLVGVRSSYLPSSADMQAFEAYQDNFVAVVEEASFENALGLAEHIKAVASPSQAVGVFAGTESAAQLADELAAALGLTAPSGAAGAQCGRAAACAEDAPEAALPVWAAVRGRWPEARLGKSDGGLNDSDSATSSFSIMPDSDAEETPVASMDRVDISDCPTATSTLSALPELEAEEKPRHRKAVKLVFLDIDGPIAPYRGGRLHHWSKDDQISFRPYGQHVDALRTIIDRCGGPDIVKVVLSSNWRTDAGRMAWLTRELKGMGVEMVGHTDVVHLHPAISPEACRVLEIARVLKSGVLGCDGPQWDPVKEVYNFQPGFLPPHWDVKDWIAIDDLSLDTVPAESWAKVSYLASFLPLPSEAQGPAGWVDVPKDFATEMASFMEEFEGSHFVHVDATEGLAGTPGAIEDAVCKLSPARRSRWLKMPALFKKLDFGSPVLPCHLG